MFRHARITTEDLQGKPFSLGRPWRTFARVVFLESEMLATLSPDGWAPWKQGGTLEGAFYAERGSTGPGARGRRGLRDRTS